MESPVYRFGEFRLDPVKRELWRGDALVEVPARAFAGLLYLIEHRERAIGRTELIEALWHRSNVSDTQLFQLILRTRRLISDEAERRQVIRTVAGFGYRWVAPTEVSYEAPSSEAASSEATSPARRRPADAASPEQPAPAAAPVAAAREAGGLSAAAVLAGSIGVATRSSRASERRTRRNAARRRPMPTRASPCCRSASRPARMRPQYASAAWTWSPTTCAAPASPCSLVGRRSA